MEQVARDLGVKLYQVHTVASFYPHFRMSPPPKVTVRICRDMACHMKGSGKQINCCAGFLLFATFTSFVTNLFRVSRWRSDV